VGTLASVIDVKLYDELQEYARLCCLCLLASCSFFFFGRWFSHLVFSCLATLCRPLEALEVIKSLLQSEFERKASKEPGSILRGASLAAKMSSRHARTVGSAYLCELFKGWIEKVKGLPELNVEDLEDKKKLIAITDEVIALIR
jgi:hypothetical protein